MTPETIRGVLAEAWSQVLDVDDVADVDFFEAGGHSLLATRLTARVRASLQCNVPLGLLFDHPRFPNYVEAVSDFAARSRPGR